MSNTLILVGKGAGQPLFRKFLRENPGADVWTMNDAYFPESTMHWDIHDPQMFDCAEAITDGCKVMLRKDFPFEKMRRRWYGSTVCYMLAYADYLGHRKVFLAGCDFIGFRRESERNAVRYWIGVLEGKCVDVFLTGLSRVFEGEEYGARL